MNCRKSVFPRLLVLPLAALLFGGAPSKPVVGQNAPHFELTLVDGSKVSLEQLRGNVIIINFWATWCVPCKSELPILDLYYQAKHQFGLRVFAVTTEDSLPLYELKKLFAVMHIAPVRRVKGPLGPIGNAVPTNFVIDRAGRVRYAKAGAFTMEELHAVVLPLLQEPAPPTTPAS